MITTLDEGMVRWDEYEPDTVDFLYDIVWERWGRLEDCNWMILK